MRLTNPELAGLIDEAIGAGWPTDLERSCRLEPPATTAASTGAVRLALQR